MWFYEIFRRRVYICIWYHFVFPTLLFGFSCVGRCWSVGCWSLCSVLVLLLVGWSGLGDPHSSPFTLCLLCSVCWVLLLVGFVGLSVLVLLCLSVLYVWFGSVWLVSGFILLPYRVVVGFSLVGWCSMPGCLFGKAMGWSDPALRVCLCYSVLGSVILITSSSRYTLLPSAPHLLHLTGIVIWCPSSSTASSKQS